MPQEKWEKSTFSQDVAYFGQYNTAVLFTVVFMLSLHLIIVTEPFGYLQTSIRSSENKVSCLESDIFIPGCICITHREKSKISVANIVDSD